MPVETQAQTVDQIPEINEIWLNPPTSLITDRASLDLGINLNAIGFAGAQRGDEAKGRFVYELSHLYHNEGQDGVAARIGGGPGAGHTFSPENAAEDIVFRMLPSAVDNDWSQVAARGELVRPDIVIKEMAMLEQRGYDVSPKRIMIDGSAFLAWPAHVERDKAEEELRGDKKVGTTQSGVGPAASDYTGRHGMRMRDLLLPPEELRKKIIEEVDRQNRLLKAFLSEKQFDPEEVFMTFTEYASKLHAHIQNTYPIMVPALTRGVFVAECAQAFTLGIDTGFQGSTTSTDTGFGPLSKRYRVSENYLGWRVGVAKLVPTFVGRHMNHSPLPTSASELLYQRTSERGRAESGSVSGRKREYYWLSIPEIRAAIATFGLNSLAVAKLDVADGLDEIHFGMEYVFPDGTRTSDFDPDDERMMDSETRMNTLRLPGWKESTAGLQNFEDAPRNLRAAMATLSKLVGVPIIAGGTGPNFGEAMYAKNSPFDMSSR